MGKRSHTPEDDDENVINGMEEDVEEEEDHDDEDGGGRKRSKKKSKKSGKKVRIMSKSGMTEAQRRVLRRKQRELNNNIAMGGGMDAPPAGEEDENGGGAGRGGSADNDPEELQRLREQNNELWEDVRYTREAVLDSENVELIAGKAARQAEKMVQVPRYDAVRLAQALVRKGSVQHGSSNHFDWSGIGLMVGVCFNALPSHVSFLYGPLDAEYTPKERKKAERRKKAVDEPESENEEEEQPEDLDQTGKKKSDGNELSAVEKHIKVIRKTLQHRCKEEQEEAMEKVEEYGTQLSQEIDDEHLVYKKKKRFVKENSQANAVNCLFNPQSFTQTVENVFHFSFLVKTGDAGIRARSAKEAEEYGGMPGPVIQPHNKEKSQIPTPSQAIVSLNMKDWKDMCRAYEVEASDVPHRVDGKVAKKEKKSKKSH